ncbi:MAG: antibiotic biosynthesis monooxygenase family protein [Pseudomonadota bacterium]
MTTLVELNDNVSLGEQMQSDEDGSVVLINVFTVDPADEETMLATWARDAQVMRSQPGYISTQLHKGIGGSPTYVNYAVWESVEAFRNAFMNPDFQAKLGDYPESTTISPHLFKKLAVSGFCVA